VSLPATTTDPVREIQNTVDTTVKETRDAAQGGGQALDDTVKKVAGDGPAAAGVDGATGAADKAAEGVKNVTDGVTAAAGAITGG
jgi:hypothetical protein